MRHFGTLFDPNLPFSTALIAPEFEDTVVTSAATLPQVMIAQPAPSDRVAILLHPVTPGFSSHRRA